ncbi:uncharacterized protein LOC125570103 [Nematostella vectensis]|uniref:uncharacterized protein LOC125570103 n=1 Tax=Nematostella vectensis TaxID=45351 RepID=UPI002077491C|nr:uncharacterized protein LOC125570103 [Nematostella vectensis]
MAFDCVPRAKLFEKLKAVGVTGRFLDIIQSMYSNDKSSVKIGSSITESFRCYAGVKQGCMISPTLFNFYLSDLPEKLNEKYRNDIDLNGVPLSCILYADDLVILSKSAKGLQEYLNSLEEYCKASELSINLDKTKVMIFNNTGKTMNNYRIFYGTKFLKWLLGVNRYCSSNACRAELGRFPLRRKAKCRAIKLWLKLSNNNGNNEKLSRKAFATISNYENKNFWHRKIKQILDLAGRSDIWLTDTNTPEATYSFLQQRLYDIEQQTWLSSIQNDNRKDQEQKNKLRTLRKFKLSHNLEDYLTDVKNIDHRIALTKFRLSNHKLAIETGRYEKPYKQPNERKCLVCQTGKVEDEEHFLLECPAYKDDRDNLLDFLKTHAGINVRHHANKENNFVRIMGLSRNENVNRRLAKHIFECMKAKNVKLDDYVR